MEDNSTHISELLEDAALKGDVTTLRGLLGRDPHLLHRSSPSSSSTLALHIASKLGHLQFVQELLLLNPSLAEGLHPYERSTPLHLASGSGHVEVVKALVSSNACLCLARDVHGRNPAHVAAMKGHVDVLEELIKAVPAAARERALGGGDTIMHLCVKCNQLEALWVVARTVGDAGMLLNATDGDGNTILHIAVADKQLQIVHFLVNDNRVKKNMKNGNGLTAMDLFVQNNKGLNNNPVLRFTLEQAKVLRSDDITKERKIKGLFDWVENQRSALMVVASLVATMAFQVGVSPPGSSNLQDNHQMTLDYMKFYNRFAIVNTIGFVSSMSSIVLLISGLPGRRFLMVIVMVMMWVALTSMTYTYVISLENFEAFTSNHVERRSLTPIYTCSFMVWIVVMALLLLGHMSTTCPRRINSILV